MEEKELEQKETQPTQPKKKGGKKKVEKPVEEPVVEVNETVETVTDAPEPEAPVTDTPEPATVTETPKPETPIIDTPEPATVVENNEPAKKKPVPTMSELRGMRRYNESIFRFDDGFACVATSQRVADSKHKAWLGE